MINEEPLSPELKKWLDKQKEEDPQLADCILLHWQARKIADPLIQEIEKLEQEYSQKIEERLNKEKLKKVVDLFEEAIKHPKMWASRLFYGKLMFKMKKYEKAEKLLQEAVLIQPGLTEAENYLSQIPQRRDDRAILSEIEDKLRKIIEEELKKFYVEDEKQWWKKGVPKNVRIECVKTQEEDEEESFPYLFYAQMSGYKEIIEKNWEEIFDKTLRNAIKKHFPLLSKDKLKKEVIALFEDLRKIRNILMHSRRALKDEEREKLVRFRDVLKDITPEEI